MGRSPSRARRIATRSSSRPTRSPRPGSTTSRSAIGTRRRSARPETVTYAYAGAPEAVALDQDRAGKVLLIECSTDGPARTVTVEERTVGATTFEKLELDASGISSQPTLVSTLTAKADPDLVLDVRLVGVRPDELDIDTDEVETALSRSFLKVRVRDVSKPAMTEGTLPSPDTIAGAFIRDLEARIAALEAGPSPRPTTRPRRPNCATPFASAACCWPATRSRCEDPPAARPEPAALSRARYRPVAGSHDHPRAQ